MPATVYDKFACGEIDIAQLTVVWDAARSESPDLLSAIVTSCQIVELESRVSSEERARFRFVSGVEASRKAGLTKLAPSTGRFAVS